MTAMPEDGIALWATEESILPRIHVRVNPRLGFLFLHHPGEFNITPDAAAEETGSRIEVELFSDDPELQGRVSLRQDHDRMDRRELFREMCVPGDEDPALRIGSLDQVVGSYAHIPLGIITYNPQVFTQPDDHVVHHEARGTGG